MTNHPFRQQIPQLPLADLTLSQRLRHQWNRLWFCLRSQGQFQRQGYTDCAEDKTTLFLDDPEKRHLQDYLEDAYNLKSLPVYANASHERYAEMLATLHWLDVMKPPVGLHQHNALHW